MAIDFSTWKRVDEEPVEEEVVKTPSPNIDFDSWVKIEDDELTVEDEGLRAAAQADLENKQVGGQQQPRGIRNNNPGNIELGEKWEGMTKEQGDERFIQFESPEHGIRAMAKILNTYKTQHGLNTVEGIVSRWAPPEENDTEAYIKSVSDKASIGRDEELSEGDIGKVIKAMIHHENGVVPYSEDVINKGVELANNNG